MMNWHLPDSIVELQLKQIQKSFLLQLNKPYIQYFRRPNTVNNIRSMC